MGQNNNIGQQNSLSVFGNPASFEKHIRNHGQLCKIKQALPCPCSAKNHGSPDDYCELCDGNGFIYKYQRDFFISDEQSRGCSNKIYPFYTPIRSVKTVQAVLSDAQGGIREIAVNSFSDTEIVLSEQLDRFIKKRVSYYYDGWTLIENDELTVLKDYKIFIANGTKYDAGLQSSNPLDAYLDIVKIKKIYNEDGSEITNYKFNGNTIEVNENVTIKDGKYYADYYVADSTFVLSSDIKRKNNSEEWTHELTSGECKMAFFPWWNLTTGDLIILASTVVYKNETLTHTGNKDKLWEIEVFELDDTIIDEDGNSYSINTDYILQGNYIRWIGNKPSNAGKVISLRYGYKPTYIIFEDNPEPNNLENKQYPKLVYAKSWSKINKDDVKKLIGG